MEQIDLSFIEDGANHILRHAMTFVIILGIVAILSVVVFKFLKIPRSIANALTKILVLVAFVIIGLYYYFPGVVSGLS